jgi:hypothetical protein
MSFGCGQEDRTQKEKGGNKRKRETYLSPCPSQYFIIGRLNPGSLNANSLKSIYGLKKSTPYILPYSHTHFSLLSFPKAHFILPRASSGAPTDLLQSIPTPSPPSSNHSPPFSSSHSPSPTWTALNELSAGP